MFDVSFRQQCATAPVCDMLSGTIKHDTIHNSIQIALQLTAEAMLNSATQNPDTSGNLSIAAQQLSSPLLVRVIEVASSALQREPVPSSLPTRRVRDDMQSTNTRSPVAIPARAHTLPPHQGKTKADPLAIRAAILASFNDIPVPFASCAKLQCKTQQCELCRAAFQKVNLTKCVGHVPCHPTGWYVHLSPALVHGLNKIHLSGEPLLLQHRAPAKGEIPSPWEPQPTWAEDTTRPQSPTHPPMAKAPTRGKGRGAAQRGSRGTTPSRVKHHRAAKRSRLNPPDEAMGNMRISNSPVATTSRDP